ncbi:hypothetical protein A7J57_16565 [Agrobacterium tumefaciens]|uniref:Uncharacterized protein n=1 Tax=Agrobacterium tumefaciens TaxID=358 RepID=A0A176XIB4_AGRTU|nr:hypothetical protein A7J57_16565 [Agrobacterium tumefaciens]
MHKIGPHLVIGTGRPKFKHFIREMRCFSILADGWKGYSWKDFHPKPWHVAQPAVAKVANPWVDSAGGMRYRHLEADGL